MMKESRKMPQVVYKPKPKLAGLSSEEMKHLNNIAFGGLMRTTIPQHIEEDFLKKGYVHRAVGGIMITEIGHRALVGK
jgi:hypothetical protein